MLADTKTCEGKCRHEGRPAILATLRPYRTNRTKDQACPRYRCYAPHHGDGLVLLLDPPGNEVHRWQMPYSPGSWGYLLPNGTGAFVFLHCLDEESPYWHDR